MQKLNFGAVSETLFLPIYARAIETLSKNPVIIDLKSVDVTKVLDEQFSDSDSSILRAMVHRKLPKRLPVSLGLRTRAFDRYVGAFVAERSDAVIINLGCGLDTRFTRVDNGTIDWYNIDLAPVIELREALMPPRPRERNIATSVLDHEWMKRISHDNRPTMVYAEGLFMYLDESGVKELLLAIQKRFANCELVAEVFNLAWIKRMRSPWIQWKFRRQLHMSKDALFTYGVKTSREFEAFGPGFVFLDEWSYFDDGEKKLGWLNLAGRIETIRKMQWTVHYRISLQ